MIQQIRMMDYMVHFETNEYKLQFEVYPIHDEFLKKLEGTFCWKGVWEGRLYFTDDEYWGVDISELSELYNDYIVKWCKDFIKKRNPNDYYDN